MHFSVLSLFKPPTWIFLSFLFLNNLICGIGHLQPLSSYLGHLIISAASVGSTFSLFWEKLVIGPQCNTLMHSNCPTPTAFTWWRQMYNYLKSTLYTHTHVYTMSIHLQLVWFQTDVKFSIMVSWLWNLHSAGYNVSTPDHTQSNDPTSTERPHAHVCDPHSALNVGVLIQPLCMRGEVKGVWLLILLVALCWASYKPWHAVRPCSSPKPGVSISASVARSWRDSPQRRGAEQPAAQVRSASLFTERCFCYLFSFWKCAEGV